MVHQCYSLNRCSRCSLKRDSDSEICIFRITIKRKKFPTSQTVVWLFFFWFVFWNDTKLLFSIRKKKKKRTIGYMALEICITVLTYRSAPWRFTLPGGNVAFLLVGPTGCLVGTEIWELNGIIISCAELSHTAVFAVNHTVSVNSLYQTADQNKSLLSSFSTSGLWGGIHTVTSIWQYRARERASGFCLPGLKKNELFPRIIFWENNRI